MTEAVFAGQCPQGFPADIVSVARRKLGMLNAAPSLNALRVPPANRLEALKKDRKGQYSIRINDQWRICFAGPAPAHTTWKSSMTIEDVQLVKEARNRGQPAASASW